MTPDVLHRSPRYTARVVALGFLDTARRARKRFANDDPEALHDFRVALRRLRSCLRAYRSYVDDTVTRRLRKRLRRTTRATGEGRDAEVQLAWLDRHAGTLGRGQRVGLQWVRRRLDARRRRAYDTIRDDVLPKFAKLDGELAQALTVYRVEERLNSEPGTEDFAHATAERVREYCDELGAHLARIASVVDVEETHASRIAGKRLRYLIEPVAEVLPLFAPAVRSMKTFQDLFGELCDAHVLGRELVAAAEADAAQRARTALEHILLGNADDSPPRAAARARLAPLARLVRAESERLFAQARTNYLSDGGKALLQPIRTLADTLDADSDGSNRRELN